ncbi:MAG: LysM peptidoglycan-binding domain-containing protein [Pseudomonadota bacterium]
MASTAPSKLTITAYSDSGFKTQVGQPFSVWVNPASYTHNTSITYNDRQAQGSSGPSPEFNRVAQEEVSFELLFDATGVIPVPPGQSYTNGVADGINQLTTMAATLNGSIHSPNYLILAWAQLQFQCVMQSMNLTYTLFMPDGTPLRAKAQCSFLSYTSETQLSQESGLESPDVTHLVTVLAGDTLPLLCYNVYGDSGYYREVASVNGLLDFRNVAPGTQLLFPPLTGSAS